MDDPTDELVAPAADRLRGPKRLLAWGSGIAVLLSFGSSALGASGELGLVLLLLLLALLFGIAGSWIGLALLRDQFRGEATSSRHWGVAVALFVSALVCMTAVAGLGASS